MIRAFGYHVVPAQTHIAQLLLPYTVPNIQDIKRGGGGFGSTNNQSVFWTTSLKLSKPFRNQRQNFPGPARYRCLYDFYPILASQLVTTEADISITGIGGNSQPHKSV